MFQEMNKDTGAEIWKVNWNAVSEAFGSLNLCNVSGTVPLRRKEITWVIILNNIYGVTLRLGYLSFYSSKVYRKAVNGGRAS
jgi:hypothetical protein